MMSQKLKHIYQQGIKKMNVCKEGKDAIMDNKRYQQDEK